MKLLKLLLKIVFGLVGLVLISIIIVLGIDNLGTRYLNVKDDGASNNGTYLITHVIIQFLKRLNQSVMIDKPHLIAIAILISNFIYGQQHVEPYMIEIPTQTINYKINKAKKSVTVSNFYISELPESMEQYKVFISECDRLSLIKQGEHIYPKIENLKKCGLQKEAIDFIRDEYFVKEAYNAYPVIGLDDDQIRRYLDWKTNKVGWQILKDNHIVGHDSLSYVDALRNVQDSIRLPLQTQFLLPLEMNLISAFETVLNQSKEHHRPTKEGKDLAERKSPMLKRLKIENIYAYSLANKERYLKLDELIDDPKGQKKSKTEIGNLIHMSTKKKRKYVTSNDNVCLKPWRAWHIKI